MNLIPEQAAFEAFQASRAEREPMMPATAWTHPAVNAARPDWKAAAAAAIAADPARAALSGMASTMYAEAQAIAPATGRPDELPDLADQVRSEVLHQYAGRILALLGAPPADGIGADE